MKVIILRGLAGSGKSTLATKLVRSGVPALIWTKDLLFDLYLENSLDWDVANRITYTHLYRFLLQNKDSNSYLIVDAPFYRQADIEKINSFCSENEIIIKSVLLSCSSESEWRNRIDQRAADPAPNQKITNFMEFLNYYGSTEVEPLAGEFLYDSSSGTEDTIDQLISYIG